MTRTGRPLQPRKAGTFAAALTRLRLAAGLTQSGAGELLGRNLRSIQRWESDGIEPDILIQSGALAALKAKATCRRRMGKGRAP